MAMEVSMDQLSFATLCRSPHIGLKLIDFQLKQLKVDKMRKLQNKYLMKRKANKIKILTQIKYNTNVLICNSDWNIICSWKIVR